VYLNFIKILIISTLGELKITDQVHLVN